MTHLVGNSTMLVELHVFFGSLRRMDLCHLFWKHYIYFKLLYSLKRTSSWDLFIWEEDCTAGFLVLFV